MKLKWVLSFLLSSSAFGALEFQTYDACLGEEIVYICKLPKNISGFLSLSMHSPAHDCDNTLITVIGDNQNIIGSGLCDIKAAGVLPPEVPEEDDFIIGTFKGNLTDASEGLELVCTGDNSTMVNYTIHALRSAPPEQFTLLFNSDALQISWEQQNPRCIQSQQMSLSRSGMTVYSAPGNTPFALIPKEAFSPGDYAFRVEVLDQQNTVLTSEPYYFRLELPEKPELEAEVIHLDETRAQLRTNWTSKPVLPALSALYLRLNDNPPDRLPADISSHSQTVDRRREYRIVIYGESWLGNGSEQTLTVYDQAESQSSNNIRVLPSIIVLGAALLSGMQVAH